MTRILIGMTMALCVVAHAEQACNEHVADFNPSNLIVGGRYQVVSGSNGTEILDRRTDLIWQRCSIGQTWNGTTCAGTAVDHTWIDALKTVPAVRATINPDYRMPSIKELSTLIEIDCVKPSMNIEVFPNLPTLPKEALVTDRVPYWTSSPYVRSQTEAWRLNIWNGTMEVGNKTQKAYVRLVRAKTSDTPPVLD